MEAGVGVKIPTDNYDTKPVMEWTLDPLIRRSTARAWSSIPYNVRNIRILYTLWADGIRDGSGACVRAIENTPGSINIY